MSELGAATAADQSIPDLRASLGSVRKLSRCVCFSPHTRVQDAFAEVFAAMAKAPATSEFAVPSEATGAEESQPIAAEEQGEGDPSESDPSPPSETAATELFPPEVTLAAPPDAALKELQGKPGEASPTPPVTEVEESVAPQGLAAPESAGDQPREQPRTLPGVANRDDGRTPPATAQAETQDEPHRGPALTGPAAAPPTVSAAAVKDAEQLRRSRGGAPQTAAAEPAAPQESVVGTQPAGTQPAAETPAVPAHAAGNSDEPAPAPAVPPNESTAAHPGQQTRRAERLAENREDRGEPRSARPVETQHREASAAALPASEPSGEAPATTVQPAEHVIAKAAAARTVDAVAAGVQANPSKQSGTHTGRGGTESRSAVEPITGGDLKLSEPHRKAGREASSSAGTDTTARVKLVQRVSRAFQHLGHEGGVVRLRLAPAELGSVRVEMQVTQRKIQARVVAETEAASALLREHLPELRSRLESFGMQVEQIEVETESQEQSSDFNWHRGEQQRRESRQAMRGISRPPLEPAVPSGARPVEATADVGGPLPAAGVDLRL